MEVDFKITTWERIRVPKDKQAEVLSLLESGEVTNANELGYIILFVYIYNELNN